jgi:hypothetical protein
MDALDDIGVMHASLPSVISQDIDSKNQTKHILSSIICKT